MNVASSGRNYLIVLGMLCVSGVMHSMVMDSRYFPWLEQLYTGSDHRHGHITADGFLIIGGKGFRAEARAREEEQIVSIPELWGELKLASVGNALTLAGQDNPIPADWRWLADFGADMPTSMQGEGIDIEAFWPISKHFGLGGSTLIMRLNSFVSVVPTDDSVKKLYLEVPGNQVLFTSMMNNFYKELNINTTTSEEIGAGDTVVYAAFYDVREYEYKMRKIDVSLWLGGIIPTGVKQNPYNLASVPFGGNGLWGAFIAPTMELELREDLKFGMQARLTKRFSRGINSRLPLEKEQPLFAPTVGCAYMQSGITVTGSAYVAFEDLRAGFGIQAKYTATYHAEDTFSSKAFVNGLSPNFSNLNCRSSFISEYATIRLVYDVAHDRAWKHRPLVGLSWDIPRNHIGGKGFARTNRVLLGCTVNF